MYDPQKQDPYQTLAVHATKLQEVCKYIVENEKVKPNYETTINHYHAVVMQCLDMLEHIQQSIEAYKHWNSGYGEDRED